MIQSAVSLNEAKPLPDGWRWVRLGDVCGDAETRDPTISPETLFQYIDISGVDATTKRILSAHAILGKDAPSRARQVVKANDILVATTRPNLNAVALVPTELDEEICSTGFCVLRPASEIDPLFIFFFVQTSDFVRLVSGEVRGMLYPAVTDSQVRAISIPLPPLSEQKRIAAKVQELMKEVEHARTACEARLEAARALPQAYLRQVFESAEAKKWERRRLGEMCEEVYRYPTYYSIEYVERGIPEIRGALIKEDGTLETDLTKYRFISKETSEGYSRTVLREGDFVLSVRGSMGKVALVPNELDGANMTANLIRISPNRTFVYSPFLKLVFLSTYFQNALEELSPQTTIRTIKAPMLKSISIVLPPLAEQKRIAIELQAKMEEAEKLKASIGKQLEAIKALPQAILRKAFRGEL